LTGFPDYSRLLGIRLALDDFGTGYSSLGYLNRFPIDIIKIDKTFVDRMSGAVEDVALVKAIIQLSKSFGLSTVAEGIEEADQAERLATLGCLLGQGFLWSRPVLPEKVSDVLARQLPGTGQGVCLAPA
jgi:EAL domain-containing protein (putative c-di-GMP-specific phosphodiesterase class I)